MFALVLAPAILAVLPPSALQEGAASRPAKAAEAWSQEELERVSAEIGGQIEKLRHQAFKHPVAVEISDKQGLIEYAKKREEEFESPERERALEEVAKLLGLIPPGLDLEATMMHVLEQQVGGFYDPGTKKFYLMRTFTGDLARFILAHELTHALDDQYYDIDSRLPALSDDTDATEAYRAVLEGSATYATQAWMFQYGTALDPKALLSSQDLTTGGLEDAPAFVWKPLVAAYMEGLAFLVRGDKLDVEDYLAKCFESPPRSTEQVLHPDKYWVAAKRDEPRRVELRTAEVPEGWSVLAEDTFGELYAAMLTSPVDQRGGLDLSNPFAVLGIKYTNEAASGWDGDRLVLLGKGEARVLRQVSVWDTPEDAGEYAEGVRKAFGDVGDAGWESAPTRSVELASQAKGEAEDVVVIDVCWGVGAGEAPKVGWSVGRDPLAKEGVER
jgi:hypothetical protein